MSQLIPATLLCLLLLGAPAAKAQNTLDKAGLGSGVTASAAYSVRLLSSSYTGNALQVRRSSDNTTKDIGFTTNGDLDSATLKTFVGSNSGYVSIWYDQSGHGLNLTEATATYQPRLVNAGVIDRENSRPFFRFYTSIHDAGYPNRYNSLALATPMTTMGHVSSVMKFATGGYGFVLSSSVVGYYYYQSYPGTKLYYSGSTSVLNGNAWVNGTSYAPTNVPWPTTLTVEELEPQTPSTNTRWDNIGNDRNCCHMISGGGGFSELIIFSTALSSTNRSALASNQGAYYGMTVLALSWLDFTARLSDQKVFLNWSTASEQNSKSFTVQYSTDGSSYTDLATLPAAGNSSTTRKYSYVHYAPQPGDNYYRICETDANGQNNYSSVDIVQVASSSGEFRVMQNPVVDGRLLVKVLTPTTLSLYSMDGKMLWGAQFLPGLQTISMEDYPKGLYVLSGRSDVVQVLTQ